MNRTADPANDLSAFAWGNWNATIPADKPMTFWGTTLDDKVTEDLRTIIDGLNKRYAGKFAKTKEGSVTEDEEKVALLWYRLSEGKDDPKGNLETLGEYFAAIEAIRTKADLERTVAMLHRIQVFAFFKFMGMTSLKNSSDWVLNLMAGGMGLSSMAGNAGLDESSYYTDPNMAEMRQKYTDTLARLFELYGESAADAKAHAKQAFDAEMEIAKTALNATQLADWTVLLNQMPVNKLRASWDWAEYFKIVSPEHFDWSETKEVVVDQPKNLRAVTKMITDKNAADWKPYLKAQLLGTYGRYISEDMFMAVFDFVGKFVQGQETPSPLWQRNMYILNGNLGMAVGKLYCKNYFSETAQAALDKMVKSLIDALEDVINEVPWMSEATKKKAQEKRALIQPMVGCPKKWQDYSNLVLDYSDNTMDILLKIAEYKTDYDFGLMNKPSDRQRWILNPQDVNAMGDAYLNRIFFSAAFLQSPAFEVGRDIAVNYGSIGAVLGHELTHLFDANGRNFDAYGNVKDWWTPEDTKDYDAQSKRIVDSYSKIEVLPGKFVNGELTLSENIADIGGLKVAFKALETALEGENAADNVTKDGFTPAQRFFLSLAQFWKIKAVPQFTEQLLVMDWHAPSQIRGWAASRNLQEFVDAFQIKEGDKMYLPPQERGSVW